MLALKKQLFQMRIIIQKNKKDGKSRDQYEQYRPIDQGRGIGTGRGRGLGRGPRDGRGRGRGGGGRRRW